ncbi:MAG: heme-binding domain-containing protein [Planctomycetes bacterium]|nr:heme-binding domain-containing protein [Planctomycetota bacterium]
MFRKLLIRSALVVLGVLALIQVLPYGRAHDTPPILKEPAWDCAATRELARRACFDCHSNETRWPWYAHVAPVSWLVQHDVEEGRSKLNFSEWSRPQHEADEAEEVVREGEMPPYAYVALHSSAHLTAQETLQLAQGLARTLGSRGERRELTKADEDDAEAHAER